MLFLVLVTEEIPAFAGMTVRNDGCVREWLFLLVYQQLSLLRMQESSDWDVMMCG